MNTIKQAVMPIVALMIMIPMLVVGSIGTSIIHINKGMDFLIELWGEHRVIFLFASIIIANVLSIIFLGAFDLSLQICNWLGLYITVQGKVALSVWICFLIIFFSYRFVKSSTQKDL